MKSKFLLFAGIFFILIILFVPLDFFGNLQFVVTQFLFEGLTKMFLSIYDRENVRIDFSSDSISLFLLMMICMLLSAIFTLMIRDKNKKILHFLKEIVALYLAFVLIKYGFDKIFKAQFYLPEPNILYTRFGNLDKDILYWSTMGTSTVFSVFLGITETLTGFLLICKRTRTVGLLFSVGIFTHVLAVNLGFDISVKLFSFVLLLMTVFLLQNEWQLLYDFFILKKRTKLETENLSRTEKHPFFVALKTLFTGLCILAVFRPYLNVSNFNDDTFRRPFLHGAFKSLDKNSAVKYVFFHRDSYIILMDENDRFSDFHYTADSSGKSLILEDYNGVKKNVYFFYQKKDSLLTLNFDGNILKTKQQNWKKMNALKPAFHLFIEDVK
ncbi:hypothetical protein ASG01_04305 [Chryseobacterium sp. Leaf180]|uniref:hypothetical protein n=1 Tax=Chryseobacterium sp. Leaf180 TaxID=1736289 RepID=UPI0006FA8D95|nr:hypothetical protein [Chryseobacterium sp. Leaf180]KQR95085.1 hypothetical protein ASG01_04305 [Chryseobacterium sp. Leaf180]